MAANRDACFGLTHDQATSLAPPLSCLAAATGPAAIPQPLERQKSKIRLNATGSIELGRQLLSKKGCSGGRKDVTSRASRSKRRPVLVVPLV